MKMKNIILTALAVLCCFVGCGKNAVPKPDGLPKLYPCKLNVSFGGKYIEGVRVVLLPQSEDSKWKPSGSTDAEGNVELAVTYGYTGVPVGLYIATFSLIKEPDEDAKKGTPTVSLIPLKYALKQSKETVEVVAGQKNEFAFNLDAGEEVLRKK
jgi:hypothetical protein